MLNKLLNKIIPDRFRFIGGYKLDRLIFQIYFLLFVIFALLIVWHYDFNMDYFECNAPHLGMYASCKNPFYVDSWKNQEYLPAGHYGNNPTDAISYLELYAIGVAILAVFINHFRYNKDYKL